MNQGQYSFLVNQDKPILRLDEVLRYLVEVKFSELILRANKRALQAESDELIQTGVLAFCYLLGVPLQVVNEACRPFLS